MKTEPDADGQQVRYISDERVTEMLRESAGGVEFFVQILLDQGTIIGLTNYGRIFRRSPSDASAWFEIPGPQIEP